MSYTMGYNMMRQSSFLLWVDRGAIDRKGKAEPFGRGGQGQTKTNSEFYRRDVNCVRWGEEGAVTCVYVRWENV